MIRPELLRDIGDLANEELLFANQKFPLFASPHEGYGTMKEELEESKDEFKKVKEGFKLFWEKIKLNENACDSALSMEIDAIKCIAEMVQFVAMCRKYRDSLGAKG